MKCIISSILILVNASAVAAPTIHISNQLVKEKAGCVDYLLDVVEQSLLDLHSQAATVYLGEYEELEQLLVKAGTDRRTAKIAVDAVVEVHAAAFNYPALQFTAAVFDDLVAHKKILICTVSKKCSLARAGSNFMIFTEQHEGIVLMPPPLGGAQQFAWNLFSSLGTSAGERILIGWLQSGFSQQKKCGAVDHYYREFASQYDGAFPPNPSSLDQGFVITFMSLFQMLIADNIYEVHRPKTAADNRAHLAKSVYVDLMFGRNRAITSGVVQKLKLTESNLFAKANELLNTILATINDGRDQS